MRFKVTIRQQVAKAPRHNESSMCCTETQQSFQGEISNISGLILKFVDLIVMFMNSQIDVECPILYI